MYDKNHRETIKDIEKEISYLKGKLVKINQLLSNLRNKSSTCFIQGDAFPRKPTEESNENIDFAIDTPPKYLTIPLNSTNWDGGDDLLKTRLDEKLKEFRKCHHQKYLNTKPIINIINKSNCLEEKCELIIENIITILKLALNIKLIVKSQEMKKQNLLEKQIHVRNLHQKNQQNFTKFREIFAILKMIIMKKSINC